MGQLPHKVPGARQVQNPPQRLVRGLLVHNPQIFRHRSGKHGVPLRHIGEENPGGSRSRKSLTRTPSLHYRTAVLGPDNPKKQPEHGGLPLPGGAHQGHNLPRRRIKVGVLQDHISALIAEPQVPGLHPDALGPVFLQELPGHRILGPVFPGELRHGHHPACRRGGGDGAGHQLHNGTKAGRQATCHLQEQNHGAVSNIAAPEPVHPPAKADHRHHRPHQGHEGRGSHRELVVFQLHLTVIPLDLTKLPAVQAAQAKGFDHLDILEGLLMEHHHLRADLPDPSAVLAHPPHEGAGHHQSHRRAEKRQTGQGGIVIQNDPQGPQKLHQPGHRIGQPTQDAAGYAGHVVVHPVQKVAGVVLGHGLPVRRHDLVIDLRPNLLVHLHLDLGGNASGPGVDPNSGQLHQHIEHRRRRQGAGVKAGDHIHNVLAEDTGRQAHPRPKNPQEDIPSHSGPIPPPVSINPGQLAQHLTQLSLFDFLPDPFPAGHHVTFPSLAPAALQAGKQIGGILPRRNEAPEGLRHLGLVLPIGDAEPPVCRG